MTELQAPMYEYPEEFGALATVKPGEPHWTLQGGDPLAPLTIMFWVWLARVRAGAISWKPRDCADSLMSKPIPLAETEAEQRELLFRATSSEQKAWEMQAYQKGYDYKSDQQAAMAEGYKHTSMINSGSEEALQSLLDHRQRVNDVRAIDNAVAVLTELGGRYPQTCSLALINELKDWSTEILPGRR